MAPVGPSAESRGAGHRPIVITSYSIHYTKLYDTPPLQVAFLVPKRSFRKATARNLIRRRMREAYRLHYRAVHKSLQDHGLRAAAVIIFTGKTAPDYREAEGKIILLLQRFTEKLS